MAIARIVVDLDVVDRKIQSFITKLQTLKKVMDAVDTTIKVLTATSWVSPAAKALLTKFQILKRQLDEALRIVDEYIHDLMVVRTQYGAVEKRLQDLIGGLNDGATIFNV